MRILITGGTGVIGRRVIPLCVQRGHQVTALARSPDGQTVLESLGARAVIADLLRREQLSYVMPGHDAVVNLATHMPSSLLRMMLPGAWRENDRIRRDGSAKLVDAALVAGVGRFVQESFALTYPDLGDEWIDESVPLEPVRYNRTVLDAERSAARVTEAGSVGIVLRFAAFYGPDGRFFAETVRAVKRGIAPLFGSPDAYLSSISHDDAAIAVLAALEIPAGTYNVVDDEPVTHREYVDSLADALGVRRPRFLPSWLAPLLGTPARVLSRSSRMSNLALRNTGAWAPRYRSVREGWPHAVAPFLAPPRVEAATFSRA